jgi:O-antigen/teichoic acid export membrane protein
MNEFLKHTVLLFFALRIGDIVNVAAGMWFVPKYVKPEDIGAVLPVTSFATFLSLPVFAFAMTVMKESAYLASIGDRCKIKTLLSGVFIAIGLMIIGVFVESAVSMPYFLDAMRVSDRGVEFFVGLAAFLGCVAPVYTDALQSLKRFRALAGIEVVGSVVRFLVMIVLMPAKALIGYFAGQAALPLFRIFGSVVMLKRDLSVPAEPFWNKGTVRRMTIAFIAILIYQAIPMSASLLEQSMIRTSLSATDSAGYYMVSRFADFLYYLTFPLLLVMFPYTASAAEKGHSTSPYVVRCGIMTLVVSILMALIYGFFGSMLLPLMPNGEDYMAYVGYMPWLVIINALTTCQVFYANAEVSAGRFGFLGWFIPLHLIYMGGLFLLQFFVDSITLSLIVWCLAAISILRFLFSLICLLKR